MARATAIGVQLWRDGDRLRYHDDAVGVDQLLPEIAQFKPALLELLDAQPQPVLDINRARRRLMPGLSRLMCDKDALDLVSKLDSLDAKKDIQ